MMIVFCSFHKKVKYVLLTLFFSSSQRLLRPIKEVFRSMAIKGQHISKISFIYAKSCTTSEADHCHTSNNNCSGAMLHTDII